MSQVTETLRAISIELRSNRNILKNLRLLCLTNAPIETYLEFGLIKMIMDIKFQKGQKEAETIRKMVIQKLENLQQAAAEKENQEGPASANKAPAQALKRKASIEGPAPSQKRAAPPPASATAVAPAPAPVQVQRRQLHLGKDQMMKNMIERHRQRAQALEAGKQKAASNMAEHKRAQQERFREAQARKNGEFVEEPKKVAKGKTSRRY